MNSTLLKHQLKQFQILTLICLCLSARQTFGQTPNRPQTLVLNQIIERPLKGGEMHFYDIELKQGQVLRVDVLEKNINLKIILFRVADGQVIAHTDFGLGFGREILTNVIESAGLYAVIVGAPESALSGNYQLTAKLKQITSANDFEQIKAESIMAEGLASGNQGTSEGFRSAIGKWEEALSLWKKNGDKYWEGYTANFLGRIYSLLGEKQKSLAYYHQALPLRKVIGDKRGEAETLGNIGGVYYSLGEKQKALDYLNQVLPLFKVLGDKDGEAGTLNNIGSVYSSLGEYQKALDYFNQALLLHKAIGDKEGEATTLDNIGGLYFSLGEYQKALDYSNQSLSLYRATGYKGGEAITLGNIGSIYSGLGEKQKALAYFSQSLSLRKIVGDKAGEATTLNNIGGFHYDLGEYQKALEFYNQSLPLRHAVGDKAGEATTLSNIGAVYSALNEKTKALEFYNQALPIYRAVGDKSGQAVTLNNLMSVWNTQKVSRYAVFYGKQSVNLYQELRQNINALDKEIQKTYLKTIEHTYRDLADILIADGRFAQAELVLRMLKDAEYFEFVRRDAGEIKNLNSRVALSQTEKDLIARYELLADRVTEIGARLQKLQERKSMLSRTDAELPPDEQKQFDELSKQIADANAAFKLFLDKELAAELKPEKAGQIEVDRSLQDKLKKWGAGVVALTTVVGEDRYRVILTTPTVQIDGKTEIKAAELNEKIFAFRAALQNPAVDPRPLGREIYDVLLKPIEKQLEQAGAKTLLWSLDGTLRYLPLAALSPDGKAYLIEKYQSVVVTPKIRDGLSDEPAGADWRALGLGVSAAQTVTDPDNPNAKISFNQLPGTKAELAAIVSEEGSKTGVLAGKRFMDETFTTKNLIDSLGKETADGTRRYTVVHIASHFRLGGNRANSFLLLGNNQILSLEEISKSANISFGGVDLITLSACNTAFADENNGKEVDSLAEVIQTKSGKAVLATLWAVADESTQLLMSEFYRIRNANQKLTKSEAMQAAQQAMISGKLKSNGISTICRSEIVNLSGEKQTAYKCDGNAPFAHPYFWSPFVLIGNWR